MRKSILFVLSFVVLQFTYAQQNKDEDSNMVFEKIPVDAEFPGGVKAWKAYLQKNLRIQEVVNKAAPKQSANWKQTAIVKFIIDREGNVTNVVVTNANDLHKEVVKEAIRVVSSSPPWSPSEQCGQPVKTYQTERITFCDCKED